MNGAALSSPRRPAAPAAHAPDAVVRRIAEAAPAMLWSARLDGHADWMSPAWSTFTGLPGHALTGEGWEAAVHPEDIERVRGIRAASFQAGTPFSLDYRVRRHDGQFRWLMDHGAPCHDDGAVVGYVGSAVDIDERKALEETLAERTQQMRLAERRQGHFLGLLSHELRNPLAPIANAASVLRTLEPTHPSVPRLREILERQVGRLSSLIAELIDVTRAAQGHVSLVREQVSVESVVDMAIVEAEPRLREGSHRVVVDVRDDGMAVRGDRQRLAQALAHLLGNAARFTPQPSTIELTVRRVARTVQLSVKDVGSGIEASFLPHAFELFARQDGASERSRGLGVGLTLVRRIAQLHGGDVEGWSEGPGTGSEFILWLPLAEPAADVAGHAGRTAPAERSRALVIDGDAAALEQMRLSMALWATDVVTARSADEALDAAERTRPDIVLCDIGLPGLNGGELVEALKRRIGDLPVVFAAVTGCAGVDDQRRALAAGFESLCVKPLGAESLAKLLRGRTS